MCRKHRHLFRKRKITVTPKEHRHLLRRLKNIVTRQFFVLLHKTMQLFRLRRHGQEGFSEIMKGWMKMDHVYEEVARCFDEAYEAGAERFDEAYEAGAEPSQPKKLTTFDCESLSEMRLTRLSYVIDDFLRPGLAVLAGAPKVGKSWLVLYMCLQVAGGEPFWGMQTRQGTVLYIALEDSRERLQERVLRITDHYSENLHFSLSCSPLGDDLEEELRSFTADHPDTRLIVLDTFQKVRAQVREMSYANDYAEVSRLKRIADELGVCILLVHHTRKQADNDFMNEISGTNGIAGSADTLMVLKKAKRSQSRANLSCTGRDIVDRELELEFDRNTFVWTVKSDSLEEKSEKEMPREMCLLVAFMMTKGYSYSSVSDFTAEFCKKCGVLIEPNQLKRLMNRWRFELEDEGVNFSTVRRKDARMLVVNYCKAEEAEGEGDG